MSMSPIPTRVRACSPSRRAPAIQPVDMSMRWPASSETAVWMITSATCRRTAGTQYGVERRLLVGHEVDHAVGDHDVDARVVDRERLDQSLVQLDVRSPIPHALEAARSKI